MMRYVDFEPAELIGEGLAYTVMGICIVFLILIIIMFVIKAMALFSTENRPEEAAAPAPAAAPAEQEDSLELIAVLTAAVAAAMDTPASSIQIRSYKKLDGAAWNKAGRREALDNRF